MARAQHTHDVLATVGTYKDRQTGEEKKRRLKIGAAFTSPEGNISIKLDAVPVGPDWSGWLSLYPAERWTGQEPARAQAATSLPAGRKVSAGMPMETTAAEVPPWSEDDEDSDLPF